MHTAVGFTILSRFWYRVGLCVSGMQRAYRNARNFVHQLGGAGHQGSHMRPVEDVVDVVDVHDGYKTGVGAESKIA